MITTAIVILIFMAIAIFNPNDSQHLTDYELYGTDDLDEYEKSMQKTDER